MPTLELEKVNSIYKHLHKNHKLPSKKFTKEKTTKGQSRLTSKGNAVEFKDDDYETPKKVLNDLIPYIKDYDIIYDPFYCNGAVIKEWEELDKECINEKKDAFDREHPNFDIMISNVPFSCKEKCVKLGFELKKPFILLMPIDILGSKWIKKYFDKLQFILPSGRLQFLKDGIQTNKCWFDTMFLCYGLNLENKIIKL
tara:strand:+ start:32 stop:625 length:594 start_codon:yes stop_codon:yes gene_type:complete